MTPRERPKIGLAMAFIEAILEDDLKSTFNQRHTAHHHLGPHPSRDASMRYRRIDGPGVRANPED
jgi:hypothetical protein